MHSGNTVIPANSRIGRFLFNVMLASGGYSWTVVPLARRETYMTSLESASIHGDITDSAHFLGGLVEVSSPQAPRGNPTAT